MTGKTIFQKANPRRKLLGLAIGVFGITAAIACTGLEGLDQAAAQAIVQNVDSLSGEVTVQFKDGTTTTFNLADVDVEKLGQLIGDASLEAGDEIELKLDSSNNVKSVAPQISNLKATIVEVDTAASTMTVEAENGVQLVLTLTVDTRIQLDDDNQGTINDLTPGMLLKVKYDTDTNEALKIKQDDHENDDEHEAKGTITAINADDHTITVEHANGVSETYTVVPGTEIKIDGHAPFSELQVGMVVKLEFNSATLELSEIKMKHDDEDEDSHGRSHDQDNEDEHEAKGTVTAIDVDGGTVTIANSDGVETTYTVDSETSVKNGEDAVIGDLEVGMDVKIEFSSETLVLNEIKVAQADDDDDDNDQDGDEGDEE